MADNGSGLREHQRLARGDSLYTSDDFGVDKLSSHSAGGPGEGKTVGHLKDHQRGARPPIGGNQANPDHGKFK